MTTTTSKELSLGQTVTAGAIAGLSELLVMYPLDSVKTRMTTGYKFSKD